MARLRDFCPCPAAGIGTLPGGVPIYENNDCVGGIGVFFPGPNGYASFEQNNLPGTSQTQVQRENAPLVPGG